jgi:hypothetical protein
MYVLILETSVGIRAFYFASELLVLESKTAMKSNTFQAETIAPILHKSPSAQGLGDG